MAIDRREILSKAFDESVKTEEKKEEEVVVETTPDTSVVDDTSKPVVTDEKSDEYKQEKKATEKEPVVDKKIEEKKEEKPEAKVEPVVQQAATEKAPLSWKPAEKELWAKASPELKAVIQRREREVQVALTQSANARKFQDQFVETIRPFAPLIQARNSHPLQAVKNLMTTAAGLTVGNADQKAAIVAEIINDYGVDLKTLDLVLSKAIESGSQNQNRGRANIQPELLAHLAPIQNFMQEVNQSRQQRQQRIEQETEVEIEEFANDPKNAHFEDLRDDMADIMEVASRRGKKLTIPQAYAQALSLHPELSKIETQKAKAAELSQNAAALKAKQRSSSINGAPNSPGVVGAPKSRREALERGWDKATH